MAEAHPAALVFDDVMPLPGGLPGYFAPYFAHAPVVLDQAVDYADPDAAILHRTTHSWVHPLHDVIGELLGAGLRLDRFAEHDALPWRMFQCLAGPEDQLWRWPEKPWLPLSYSLVATKSA